MTPLAVDNGAVTAYSEAEDPVRTRGRSSSRAGRAALATLLVILCTLALSCKRGPVEPTAFSMGQPIPMGPFTITVTHVEVGDFSSVSGFDVGYGTKGVAVFFTLKSDRSLEKKDLEKFQRGRKEFSIQDRSGKTYSSNLILPADAFRMMRSSGQVRDLNDLYGMRQYTDRLKYGLSRGEVDMVIIFSVPFSTSGYTLLIENTRPQSGQPRLATVPLGR